MLQLENLRKVLDDPQAVIILAGGVAFLLGAIVAIAWLHFTGDSIMTIFLFVIAVPFYVIGSLSVFFWFLRKSGGRGWRGRIAEGFKFVAGIISFPALFVLCLLAVFVLEPLGIKGWYPQAEEPRHLTL